MSGLEGDTSWCVHARRAHRVLRAQLRFREHEHVGSVPTWGVHPTAAPQEGLKLPHLRRSELEPAHVERLDTHSARRPARRGGAMLWHWVLNSSHYSPFLELMFVVQLLSSRIAGEEPVGRCWLSSSSSLPLARLRSALQRRGARRSARPAVIGIITVFIVRRG